MNKSKNVKEKTLFILLFMKLFYIESNIIVVCNDL